MSVRAALQVLIDARTDNQIVVTNQGSSRIWPRLARHELDLHYNPSTMGGAIPLALGLALARPDYEVLVVTGDGSLQMSLGSLITVKASGATNLTVIILNNGLYEVTGGQQTPGALAQVDYVAIASAAGFPEVASFSAIESWQEQWPRISRSSGPRCINLHVSRADAADLAAVSIPMQTQLETLSQRHFAAKPTDTSN